VPDAAISKCGVVAEVCQFVPLNGLDATVKVPENARRNLLSIGSIEVRLAGLRSSWSAAADRASHQWIVAHAPTCHHCQQSNGVCVESGCHHFGTIEVKCATRNNNTLAGAMLMTSEWALSTALGVTPIPDIGRLPSESEQYPD